MFKRYPKIHRLGKEEVEGILEGECHIEEKIDGANTSIWMDNGVIKCGSRSKELTEGTTFNGFVDYVKSNEPINSFFKENQNCRLYGEWLVRHTIAYNELSYRKFYVYDITDASSVDGAEPFWTRADVYAKANLFGLNLPMYFGSFINPKEEDLKLFAGKTALGERGEGIVIKNHTFRDKFGSHNYAKIVTESFKEDNGVTFGGNNKHSDTYWEMYVVNKYMTMARVQKIMNKIQPLVEEKLDLKHIPRIGNTAYHDMLTEEIWEIQGKVVSLNFHALKRVATKKAIQIFKDILSGDISVADRQN